jgi:hypothetical protein
LKVDTAYSLAQPVITDACRRHGNIPGPIQNPIHLQFGHHRHGNIPGPANLLDPSDVAAAIISANTQAQPLIPETFGLPAADTAISLVQAITPDTPNLPAAVMAKSLAQSVTLGTSSLAAAGKAKTLVQPVIPDTSGLHAAVTAISLVHAADSL